MSDQLQRVVDWLDDVLAWLCEPLTAMPVERVMARLRGTFEVNVVSWSVQQGPVTTSMMFDQPDVFAAADEATVAEFMAGMHRECHPLTVWYDRTTSVDPQTASRVPTGLVPTGLRSVLVEPLARLGLEQQMTLYQRREGIHARFFVIARDHRDFDEADLAVARYVQHSLVTLDRQTRVLGDCDGADPDRHTDLGLTGRQLAVLQLVNDGLSARQAAHRLACSPRTVEKHLQRAYRKLQVNDRVNAIRVARLAGVVVEQPVPGNPRRRLAASLPRSALHRRV